LLSAIAGGVPPDVVFFDRFAIGEWASKHALEDLTPYIESQKVSDQDYIDLGQYYPWALEEASYRPPGSLEPQRVYGIPTVADARLLYTNLDLLRQEGLTERGEPKLPTTWTELREYAKRLSRFRVPGHPESGLVRLGLRLNRTLVAGVDSFEQRVALDLLVDEPVEFEMRQLQQPDRLHQLRRQRQRLRLPDLEPRRQRHSLCPCLPTHRGRRDAASTIAYLRGPSKNRAREG